MGRGAEPSGGWIARARARQSRRDAQASGPARGARRERGSPRAGCERRPLHPRRDRGAGSWGTSRKRNDCSSDSRYGDGKRDRASALAAAGRCRGMLCASQGDLVGARAAFDSAVREHSRVSLPFEHARLLLALGSLQRRTRDRRGARASLEQAVVIFERLGAAIWTERTRGELGRIAGRAPSPGELTPTERRVAELVAEGRTNKEVAAELVVTVRTVERPPPRCTRSSASAPERSSLTACAPASPRKPRSPPATRRGFPRFGLLAPGLA